MEKVNMQTRTLIFILVGMILVGVVLYFATPPLLLQFSRMQEKKGNDEASTALQERLFQFFPGSEQSRQELLEITDEVLRGEDRVVIGPNFTGGGGGGTDWSGSIDEVMNYLLYAAEAQREPAWKYNIYQRIGDLYRFQKNYQEAYAYYDRALKGFLKEGMEFKVSDVNAALVEMYMEMKEYDRAIAKADENLRLFPNSLQVGFLAWKADAYYELQEWEEAEHLYQKVITEEKKNFARYSMHQQPGEAQPVLEEQPEYHHAQLRLKELEARLDGKNQMRGRVEGQILKEGQPMPNVRIYLMNESEYDGTVFPLDGYTAQPPVETDGEGRFVFEGVVTGSYFVALGVLPEDLKGLGKIESLESFQVKEGDTTSLRYAFRPKVEMIEPQGEKVLMKGEELVLRWRPVPNAASYNIQFTVAMRDADGKPSGGYVSSTFARGVKESQYIFKAEGLGRRFPNFVTFGDTLGPEAVIGCLYPGAQIYLSVEAVDGEGRAISDSEGYILQRGGNYPWIHIDKSEELTRADQLVLDRKYPEAILAYQGQLDKDPQDPVALLSLARIYHYGWESGRQDLEKADEYYARLLEFTKERAVLQEVGIFYQRLRGQGKSSKLEKFFSKN